MKFSLIASIILSLAMALFAVQNSQQTQVTFLGKYFDGPLVIVLLITFAVGVLSMFFAMLPASFRKSMEISKLKSRLTVLSSNIKTLEKQQTDREDHYKKEIRHENTHQES